MQWCNGSKISLIRQIKRRLHIFLHIALFYAKTAKLPTASSQMLAGCSFYSWYDLSSSNVGKYLAIFSVQHAHVVWMKKKLIVLIRKSAVV